MKRTIYTIGETVYDIIFQHGQLQAGRAGGSMLNSSVSLGRLGYEVCFISEVGNDDLGNLIIDFLKTNNVRTEFIDRFNEGKTPVALAFLDDQKNAKYTFLKQYPTKRLQQPFPIVSADDIVMFGSFFSISPAVRTPLLKFVQKASEAGAVVIYDPNIRKPHKDDIPELLPMIFENFKLADIVRASHEDFLTIFDSANAEDARQLLNAHSEAALIFTRGKDDVTLHSKAVIKHYKVPQTEVVSTIGAGDSFNAGIAKALIDQEIYKPDIKSLTPDQWDFVIQTGTDLSLEVCRSFDNYVERK